MIECATWRKVRACLPICEEVTDGSAVDGSAVILLGTQLLARNSVATSKQAET